MAEKIITIDIDKEAGTVRVETEGYQGTSCQAIHDAFDSMGTVLSDDRKPEYYQGGGTRNTVTTGRS